MYSTMDQIKLMAVKMTIDSLAKEMQKNLEEQLYNMGISADVAIDIRCNGVNIDELEKKMTRKL